MNTVESSSSARDSPPYRERSLRSHSQHPSLSSPPRPSRSRVDRDRDRSRERDYLGSRSKLFARLISREERDARSVLVRTMERLEGETRRADEAERRVLETLQKLRAAHEETMIAQANAARANEVVRMYKLRLDEAQREINRAQQIVDDIEQARVDAEAEAARARSAARKFREERMISKAQEEGRRQGYQEGLSRGKDIGVYENQMNERADPRRYHRRQNAVESFSEEDDVEDGGSYSGGSPTPSQPTWRVPSRLSNSRASRRTPPRIHDTAPIDSSTPLRTLGTPLHVPSPTHAPVTPQPIPISGPSNSQSRGDAPIVPVPVYQSSPSVVHPDFDIPPDNWIPYQDEDKKIRLPPPHELSRPVSPQSSNPSFTSATEPSQAVAYEQPRRNRAYASEHDTVGLSGRYTTMSPQSRTSTNVSISQYTLLNAPREGAAGGQPNSREALTGLHQVIDASTTPNPIGRADTPAEIDRQTLSPRGPRQRGEMMAQRAQTPEPLAGDARGRDVDDSRQPRSPLDRVFKRRFYSRRSTGSGGVPDIVVQSPSSPASAATQHTTVSQPHLLSPDVGSRPMSTPETTLVQGGAPVDQRPLPPLPDIALTDRDMVFLPDGQAPPGFIATGFTPTLERSNVPVEREREAISPPHYGSPTRTPQPAYAEAPVPPNVVYPEPPGKIWSPYLGVRPLTPSATPSSPHLRRPRNPRQSGVLSPLSLRLGSPLRL